MPALRNSLIHLGESYKQVVPARYPEAFRPNPAPEIPISVRRSVVMISSLPAIATAADGIVRQFYGSGNLPTRRTVLVGF